MSKARTYSDEFKHDAVMLIKEMSIKEAADKLGIAPSTLRGWHIKSLGSNDKSSSANEELTYDEVLKKFVHPET